MIILKFKKIIQNKKNLPLDIIDIVESQDVNQDMTEPIVKVEKPRVKKKN